jgi:hypothetical protein
VPWGPPALQTGVFPLLEPLWHRPRASQSPALRPLAGRRAPCLAGPAPIPSLSRYDRTVLHSLWCFPPGRYASQAVRDVSGMSPGRIRRENLRVTIN